MTGFLLIRHASCAHVGASLPGRSPGVHLDERGRQQARQLAERLAGAPLAAVYSGPLERARETAKPLADRLGLSVQVSEALDEVDIGEWSGWTLEALAEDVRWRRWNTFRSVAPAPSGESALHVAERVIRAMEEMRARHPGAWVALVTHADVIRTAVAHLAGVPLDLMLRLEIAPASVSAVELEEWGPRILRLNDAPTPPWAEPG